MNLAPCILWSGRAVIWLCAEKQRNTWTTFRRVFLHYILSSLFHSLLFYIWSYGPGSSVGIANELPAVLSVIESRWGRNFPPLQTGPVAHPTSCTMGNVSFPAVKCSRGVLLTTHSFYCRGHGRVEQYLYPPSGQHRACKRINVLLYIWLYVLHAFVLFCKLCIFIVMYMYSYCYVCSVLYAPTNWHSSATLTAMLSSFSSVVNQCQNINRKDGTRPALLPIRP